MENHRFDRIGRQLRGWLYPSWLPAHMIYFSDPIYNRWRTVGGISGQRSLDWTIEKPVIAKDNAEALKWYRVAAEQGYREAQQLLAKAYKEGSLGLKRDSQLAGYWAGRAEGRQN